MSPENDYDTFAEAYAAATERNLVNGHYARPAVLDLLGDVAGRRILDVGCGAGFLLDELRGRGAEVAGTDGSAAMLALARERLGDEVDLHHVDLVEPLPHADAVFDDAVACLVLHYLEDWSGPLAEFRRVLRPGGRLVVAAEHPLAAQLADPTADYSAVRPRSFDWTFGEHTARMTFWDRPLHAMTDAFAAAGFRVESLDEPPVVPEAHGRFADELAAASPTGRLLCFLFVVLVAA